MTKPLIGITLGTHRPNDSDAHFWQLRWYYTHAVEQAGGAPVMIPLGLSVDTLRGIYDKLGGLLISGGGDIDPTAYGEEPSPYVKKVDATRDAIELQLIQWAVAEEKPLLAICRGHQALNVAQGGSLYQDIGTDVPSDIDHDHYAESWFEVLVHRVEVKAGSRLAHALRISKPDLAVNSLHHQAVKRLGNDLTVTARAEDGIIEGVEIPDHRFAVGVQWHPEALAHKEPQMHNLFSTLIAHTS